MDKLVKVVKATTTIKISEENSKRLYSLAGRLQEQRGKKQTPDNAITYLFENQKEESVKNGS